MATVTQQNRHIAVQTPLGPDVLLLTAFHGQEEISRLFQYRLEMLSTEEAIPAKKIVGKNVTFRINLAGGGRRYFNGFVSRFAAGSRETGFRSYYAEVVPWLWFLTRTADCRIFQHKTVPQILQQVFADLGFSEFDLSEIKGTHKPWDYCVQYRETDYNFVARLMEEEGIFYYFRHDNGKHTLVLADQKGAYKDLPEKEVEYEYTHGSAVGKDRLTSWEHQYEFVSGKWAQTDYNFKDHPARGEATPANLLMANEKSTIALDHIDKYELYDYPGGYTDKGDGKGLTRLRMEEEEAAHDVVRAASLCKTFSPGGKFTVKRHDSKAEEGKSYAITSIRHSAVEPASYAGNGGEEADYSNTFTCIPSSVVFRPRRITPKPVVHGVQTAVVTGPPGEEIYPDKYGRVKVQFFWDREGKRDEKSSCWVRVSQSYAGKDWGAMCIPRIGQEVIVDFVEGDPDRPIITGRVYNADQMPPYPLPGKKTLSGLKSHSTPGGGGYNEYVFDDTKGNELIREHGQFDKDSTILHDLREHVLHDRTRDVTNNETVNVGNNRSEHVIKNESLIVGVNRSESVGANESLTVGANRTRQVGGNETVTVAKMRTHTVGINEAIIVGAAQEINVGAARTITVGAAQAVSVGGNHSITVGGSQSESIGKKLSIDAGDEILIKTGAASISMKKDGTIKIEGKDILIQGSGKITAKASGDMVLKAAKIGAN